MSVCNFLTTLAMTKCNSRIPFPTQLATILLVVSVRSVRRAAMHNTLADEISEIVGERKARRFRIVVVMVVVALFVIAPFASVLARIFARFSATI